MKPALIRQAKARSNGRVVGIYRAEEAGLDVDAGKYATICEEHGGVVHHATLATARQWAPYPDEWCDACIEESCN